MKCKICQSKTKKIFQAKILKKYDIQYYQCENCEFIFVEESYWLEEAYKEPIYNKDTGILARNSRISKVVAVILFCFCDKNAKYLDYAGGYGILTRLMRNIGFDFYWADKYSSNLFARGFEYNPADKIEAVTIIECFEHFTNPIEEIENLLKISRNIIFTTELLPKPAPKPQDWWYYSLDGGQHISFYSKKTLEYIAEKYGLHFYSISSVFIFTEKRISFLKLLIMKVLLTGISFNIFHIIFIKIFSKFNSKTLQDSRA